jgi:hypothetical protein
VKFCTIAKFRKLVVPNSMSFGKKYKIKLPFSQKGIFYFLKELSKFLHMVQLACR